MFKIETYLNGRDYIKINVKIQAAANVEMWYAKIYLVKSSYLPDVTQCLIVELIIQMTYKWNKCYSYFKNDHLLMKCKEHVQRGRSSYQHR